VDVDDPVVDLVRSPGDRLEQLVAGEHRARAAGKRPEQPELARRQAANHRGRIRSERVAAARRIDHEAATIERPGRLVGCRGQTAAGRAGTIRRPAAPEDRRHPCRQFVRVERLGEVVVGPLSQPGDPLDVAALGRGDEDRRIAPLADGGQDGLTAQTGQHEVEDYEVGRCGIERLDGVAPVADDRNRVAVTLKVEAQDVGQPGLVLDDQDPGAGHHAAHPIRPPVKEP
jgi:hypothetical protein